MKSLHDRYSRTVIPKGVYLFCMLSVYEMITSALPILASLFVANTCFYLTLSVHCVL